MCGILAVLCTRNRFDRNEIEKALDTIAHRGPDDQGITRFPVGDNHDMWLGHRRLSILDLSDAGHQPMIRGDAAMVFNGEIYNFRDLRAALNPPREFQSGSDTELLLEGILSEGPRFVQRTNGMFAFACWKSTTRTLLLGRDRLGKKPLYVYHSAGVWAFASELKPFEALGLPLTLHREALAFYRWLSYIPAHMTIYKECHKFPAASTGTLSLDPQGSWELRHSLYWDPFRGAGTRFEGSFDDAMDAFDTLFDDAVRLRLVSDVPIGTFLSGGIDSSLVVCSLAQQHHSDVRTYTVKPPSEAMDESAIAQTTAQRLGLKNQILALNEADYERQISKLPTHYDEPFSDSSQVPTMAISEAAREHVTVVLTGDGGDELFLGYPRLSHPETYKAYRRRVNRVPGTAHLLRRMIGSRYGKMMARLGLLMLGRHTRSMDLKLEIMREILSPGPPEALHEFMLVPCPRPLLAREDIANVGEHTLLEWARKWYPAYGWDALESRSVAERLGALDMVTYMRDDILVKVDRATMAYALEARSPLLDYRIVEFALSLPLAYKIHDGSHKYLLRQALRRRLGDHNHALTKRGFSIPLPSGLPPGRSQNVRWNRFIENQWVLNRYGQG